MSIKLRKEVLQNIANYRAHKTRKLSQVERRTMENLELNELLDELETIMENLDDEPEEGECY